LRAPTTVHLPFPADVVENLTCPAFSICNTFSEEPAKSTESFMVITFFSKISLPGLDIDTYLNIGVEPSE
jgi:hypothetical protein